MVKVRFTQDFNFIPDGRLDVSVKYKAMAPDAEPLTVPTRCAEKAVAAGKAVRVSAARSKSKAKPEGEDDGANPAAR